MKIRKSLAILAGTGVLFSLSTAQAVLTAGTTDVFIGFHETGNNTGYLIDIGPVENLINATSPITFSIGTTATDLTTAFGAGWFTDSAVSWGVVGTNEAFTPVLYSTVARTDAGTIADPWANAANATAQRSVGNAIKNLKTDYRNFGDATSNSSVATFQNSSTLEFAYADFTSDSPNFGSQSTWTNIEGTFDPSAPKILDFYSYSVSGGSTHLGTFSITSGGEVTFTPVPEPSVFALVGVGLLALRARRRFVSHNERVAP